MLSKILKLNIVLLKESFFKRQLPRLFLCASKLIMNRVCKAMGREL